MAIYKSINKGAAYEEEELEDLTIQKSGEENEELLESFNKPESYQEDDDETQGSVDGSNADDMRLIATSEDTDDFGTTIGVERNVREAIMAEGNTSGVNGNNGESGAQHGRNELNTDLERQVANKRLTTKDRILYAISRLVPVKQTYQRINNGLSTGRMQLSVPGRFVGHGTDGVFRNLMAKPDRETARIEQENNPPSYEEAAADATPEYWESAIVPPMYEDEVFVEGLPVGNIANFVWNILVTGAFQFVGFVLCYLLHTSHAAKQGSRAGLGGTFIYYGYGMVPSNFGKSDLVPARIEPSDPNSYDIDKSKSVNGGKIDHYNSDILQKQKNSADTQSNTPYFAYGIIAFGIFILIKAFVDFSRIKRMERVILAPPASTSNRSTSENSEESQEQ